MLEQDKQLKQAAKPPLTPILIGVLAVATLGALLFYLQQTRQGDNEAVITDAARAYLPNLDLNNVNMEAHDDSLGQTLLEITGDITNLGEREVDIVEANCVFRDVNGTEIERQRSALVRERTGSLSPGETQTFRMAFDSVPEAWNQIIPDLFIAQIRFGE